MESELCMLQTVFPQSQILIYFYAAVSGETGEMVRGVKRGGLV